MRSLLGKSILGAVLVASALTASAQSRRVIDYIYDDAGNLIRIESSLSQNPPDVQSIAPSAVRRGPPTRVTADGTDLRLVEVEAADPTITISNVESTPTSVSFDMQASEETPLGVTTLTFTTRLGSDTAEVDIQPLLPRIQIRPVPVAVAVGQALSISIALSTPDLFDLPMSLSVGDPDIATVSLSDLTVPAGQTRVVENVTVTGVTLGTTNLFLSIPGLDEFITTVFVTEPYQFPADPVQYFSPALGVVLTPALAPDDIDRGPFTARLGVVKESDDPPPSATLLIAGAHLGVTKGDFIAAIDPDAVIADGNPVALTVTGSGLDNVTGVSVVPPDDVALSGFIADPGGASATLTATAAEGATLGPRQLVLSTATGTIPSAAPGGDRIHVAQGLPEIDSVSPPLLTRNIASASVIVRGRNFLHLERVTVTPADGITVGIPQSNDDGTEVTFALAVSEDASEGPRVVIVETVAGESDPAPSAANTITIVNGPVIPITSLLGPLLGVVKAEPPAPPQSIGPLTAPAVGVTLGSVMTALSPSTGVIGTTVDLVVEGLGLDNVNDAAMVPEDGLTVGVPVPAADGLSVTVEVQIAATAPQTLRQLQLFDAGIAIPASGPKADRFRVTAPTPVVDSVSPNFLVVGDAAVDLIILGENFDNSTSVSVLPPDDLAIGSPVVSPDGRMITVSVSAQTGAQIGGRALVVTTDAGSSPDVAGPANTLTIANEITQTISPIVAPLLGVVVEIVPDTSSSFDNFAPHVGVAVAPVGFSIEPPGVAVGAGVELFIQGLELQDVSDVEFLPADGISVDGPPLAAPDGAEVRIQITVAPDAPTTLRELVLRTAVGAEIPFTPAGANRLKIAVGLPVMNSIEPIFGAQGSATTLLVRGENLQDVTRVFAEPADGIAFVSAPTANAEGDELTVSMTIAADAPLGERVIRLDSPAGATTSEFTAANTFTVDPPP
jgi:hypothetical protein